MRLLIAMALLTYLIQPAGAEDDADFFLHGNQALLATLFPVKVIVVDSVTGGCFTNKEAVQTAAELILRRSNIKVIAEDDTQLSDTLLVWVSGIAATSASGNHKLGCAVNVVVSLIARRGILVPYLDHKATLGPYGYTSYNNIGVTAETGNDMIKTMASDGVEKFSNEVLKARDDFKSKYPDSAAAYDKAFHNVAPQ